jgi:2-keto-4-pentenoate hydratase/2-oxohepta-3-ene-1,7-dioic acid hydratase in catechol pathway
MRLASILAAGRSSVGVVRDERVLPLDPAEDAFRSIRAIAAGGEAGLGRIRAWVAEQPERAWFAVDDVDLGPAVADPGAIYAIGRNYSASAAGESDPDRPDRPLVYAKQPTSVAGSGAVLSWDRSLTVNVDAEVELAVVIGETAEAVTPGQALRHVFGYTCINDISSRDPWLDGDQWLLGKSMTGFCPVGPWIVTPDEIRPDRLRLGCTINGFAIQDGESSRMRFGVAEVISYLSRHVTLRPGDLIATGTPPRLAGPPGPDRHLEPGDEVTCWIEGIGQLTTTIA